MSIKISYRDGHWYVDVRQSPAGAFKPNSRHSSFDAAIERIREIVQGAAS